MREERRPGMSRLERATAGFYANTGTKGVDQWAIQPGKFFEFSVHRGNPLFCAFCLTTRRSLSNLARHVGAIAATGGQTWDPSGPREKRGSLATIGSWQPGSFSPRWRRRHMVRKLAVFAAVAVLMAGAAMSSAEAGKRSRNVCCQQVVYHAPVHHHGGACCPAVHQGGCCHPVSVCQPVSACHQVSACQPVSACRQVSTCAPAPVCCNAVARTRHVHVQSCCAPAVQAGCCAPGVVGGAYDAHGAQPPVQDAPPPPAENGTAPAPTAPDA